MLSPSPIFQFQPARRLDIRFESAHGLRKAMMRRMAELNLANRTLKSVSGHSRDEEVSVYTEAANQMRLADEAINLVSRWESNRERLTGDVNDATL